LVNRIREQLDVEYAVVHPQLCVDDGERFLKDLVKPESMYVIGACDPRMQRKLFGEALRQSGVDLEKQVVFLELKGLTTEEAYARVKEALAQAGSKAPA
jgi:heterodisulfide reductase subunit A-like polyferredoxin